MSSSVMRKAMVYLGLSDDDYEADRYDRSNPRQAEATVPSRAGADYSRGTTSIRPLAPRTETPAAATPTISRPTVIRPMETVTEAPVRVHVIEPIEFGDAQEIGDCLKGSQPAIVNMTSADADLARRLIDFCSGAAYGLGATMERVASKVFLITPSNVEVPPEEKQRLRERGLYRS